METYCHALYNIYEMHAFVVHGLHGLLRRGFEYTEVSHD